MTVIGCVWGAHRALEAVLADAERIQKRPVPTPTYEWCEQQWISVLRKRAPGPSSLPEWLRMELWAAWRRHLAERRTEANQLELFETQVGPS